MSRETTSHSRTKDQLTYSFANIFFSLQAGREVAVQQCGKAGTFSTLLCVFKGVNVSSLYQLLSEPYLETWNNFNELCLLCISHHRKKISTGREQTCCCLQQNTKWGKIIKGTDFYFCALIIYFQKYIAWNFAHGNQFSIKATWIVLI